MKTREQQSNRANSAFLVPLAELDHTEIQAAIARARVIRAAEFHRLAIAPLGRALRATVRSFVTWRDQTSTIRTLSALSDHTLKDIGLHRSEIPWFASELAARRLAAPAPAPRQSSGAGTPAARTANGAGELVALAAPRQRGRQARAAVAHLHGQERAGRQSDNVREAVTRIVGRLRRGVRAVLVEWRRLRLERATVDALHTLDDRALADIGLHRGDIRRVARESTRARSPQRAPGAEARGANAGTAPAQPVHRRAA